MNYIIGIGGGTDLYTLVSTPFIRAQLQPNSAHEQIKHNANWSLRTWLYGYGGYGIYLQNHPFCETWSSRPVTTVARTVTTAAGRLSQWSCASLWKAELSIKVEKVLHPNLIVTCFLGHRSTNRSALVYIDICASLCIIVHLLQVCRCAPFATFRSTCFTNTNDTDTTKLQHCFDHSSKDGKMRSAAHNGSCLHWIHKVKQNWKRERHWRCASFEFGSESGILLRISAPDMCAIDFECHCFGDFRWLPNLWGSDGESLLSFLIPSTVAVGLFN